MCSRSQKQRSIVERTKRVMDVAIDKEIEKYEKNLTFLATLVQLLHLLDCSELFGEL